MSFDRQNVKLAALVFSAFFFLYVLRLWQLQVIEGKELRQASEENHLRIVPIFAPRGIIYDRNGNALVKNVPNFCVYLLPEAIKTADPVRIAAFLGLDREDVRKEIDENRNSLEPVLLKETIPFDELARIEARLSDYPELSVNADVARDYPYGEMAAHLIGYIGKLTEKQAKDPAYADVPRGDFVGQWGIEKYYDSELRGTPGERIIEVDALGRELKAVGEIPPKKGKDIHLALDMNLQMAAESAFANRVGALVAVNPKTGELLGMVSRPAFDPNSFVFGISQDEWRSLVFSPEHPLLNRAFQSMYPPGSTFKIITAMAGLETGSVTPDEKIVCRGSLDLGGHIFRCWRHEGHGPLDIHKAIVESCDVFFYNVGMRTGIDNIAYYARSFGLGSRTGIGLGSEKAGLIPDTAWKEKVMKQPWYMGETLIASIGQGYVLVTPLQMARMVGAVGTGGRFMPDISFKKYEGGPVKGKQIPIHVSDSTIQIIQDALYGVTNEDGGTARLAGHSDIVPISGKTGTAQTISSRKGPDDAWFVAYAPSNSPDIAVSVILEHGGHGTAAAPIAKKAIEAYEQDRQDAGRQKVN